MAKQADHNVTFDQKRWKNGKMRLYLCPGAGVPMMINVIPGLVSRNRRSMNCTIV